MPRKTCPFVHPVKPVCASMRPRPDAAENVRVELPLPRGRPRFNEAAARCRGKRQRGERRRDRHLASMRPRPDAAENSVDARRLGDEEAASMRPRPDAAENLQRQRAREVEAAASMRPRPDAAENRGVGRVSRSPAGSFNEAAARCRGKRGAGVEVRRVSDPASMRPRPDAAENVRTLFRAPRLNPLQ